MVMAPSGTLGVTGSVMSLTRIGQSLRVKQLSARPSGNMTSEQGRRITRTDSGREVNSEQYWLQEKNPLAESHLKTPKLCRVGENGR